MGLDFVLLTGGASFDVIRYPLVHFWPLIEFFDLSDHFILSRVSGDGVIVVFFQNVLKKLF